jgi:hypothetical protein
MKKQLAFYAAVVVMAAVILHGPPRMATAAETSAAWSGSSIFGAPGELRLTPLRTGPYDLYTSAIKVTGPAGTLWSVSSAGAVSQSTAQTYTGTGVTLNSSGTLQGGTNAGWLWKIMGTTGFARFVTLIASGNAIVEGTFTVDGATASSSTIAAAGKITSTATGDGLVTSGTIRTGTNAGMKASITNAGLAWLTTLIVGGNAIVEGTFTVDGAMATTSTITAAGKITSTATGDSFVTSGTARGGTSAGTLWSMTNAGVLSAVSGTFTGLLKTGSGRTSDTGVTDANGYAWRALSTGVSTQDGVANTSGVEVSVASGNIFAASASGVTIGLLGKRMVRDVVTSFTLTSNATSTTIYASGITATNCYAVVTFQTQPPVLAGGHAMVFTAIPSAGEIEVRTTSATATALVGTCRYALSY